MTTKGSGGGNFDGVAPVYDALAFLVFGQRLKQAQLAFLDAIPPNASILLVGGGTGWLLEQVLTDCRPKQVLYLETSREMVNQATGRICRKAVPGTVTFRVGDETVLTGAEPPFDVILTPFLLDLFTEYTLTSQVIPHLVQALKPTGFWLVTDFVKPPAWWQNILLWTMIRFFRVVAGMETRRLANWQQCLQQSGLSLEARKRRAGGMVSAECWRL